MADEKDFLDDMIEPIEAPEQVAPEPEVTEPVADRDDKGRFAKKGEEGAPPAPEKVAFEGAATLDERRRRQEAEQRAEALEKQLQAYQSPAPSIWEDEQGAFAHNNQQVVSQAVQQATFNAKLDMSEMMTRQANPDFEAVKAEFLALAEANPTLAQQALQDPHPWNKAYQIAKNHKQMQELGAVNVADLEAKIEQRLRAEMGAAPAALPQSLADTQSARGGTNAPLGPLTLKELLG